MVPRRRAQRRGSRGGRVGLSGTSGEHARRPFPPQACSGRDHCAPPRTTKRLRRRGNVRNPLASEYVWIQSRVSEKPCPQRRSASGRVPDSILLQPCFRPREGLPDFRAPCPERAVFRPPPAAFPESLSPHNQYSVSFHMKVLSKGLYCGSILIALAAMFGVAILADAFGVQGPWRGILVILPFLYVHVVMLMLIYRMWESIQDGPARTTPGKALGFLFIPLLNIYWVFPVTRGFARDYNRHLDRLSIDLKKLESGVFFVFATLWSACLLFCSVAALSTLAAKLLPANGFLASLMVAAEHGDPMNVLWILVATLTLMNFSVVYPVIA